MLHRRASDDLLEHVGKVLEDDDDLGARVLQLVLKFARRVQRVDVDHRIAGAQRAKDADRVLQAVWHHQRDARAAREAARLQPCAKGGGQVFEFAKSEAAAHVDVRRPVAKLGAAFFKQIADGLELPEINFCRHAGRIGLEPDLFHEHLLRLPNRPGRI